MCGYVDAEHSMLGLVERSESKRVATCPLASRTWSMQFSVPQRLPVPSMTNVLVVYVERSFTAAWKAKFEGLETA